MSLFYITNDCVEGIESEWIKDLRPLKIKTTNIEFGGYKLVIAQNEQDCCRVKEIGDSLIYIEGTIFNGDFFGNEILENTINVDKLVSELETNSDTFTYFGHYLVVIINRNNRDIRIISDPIGCINVYYYKKDNKFCISNDLFELAKTNNISIEDEQTISEFCMSESNIGISTIFKEINRMDFGKEMIVSAGAIIEKRIHNYNMCSLSFEEYIRRIEKYFAAINNSKRRIGVDISAGYDTRLIASISKKNIDNWLGFTAENRNDNGVDNTMSKVVIQKLGIEANVLNYINEENYSKKFIIHTSGTLRDINRSGKWFSLFQKRFEKVEISLGGYGGEILRGKYTDYKSMQDFVDLYWKGNEAEEICGFNFYKTNVLSRLTKYYRPNYIDGKMVYNWLYAIVKMRTWASAFFNTGLMFGSVIHPFMDWYLMQPIFGFNIKELENGRMQRQIIDYYAPELKNVPINRIDSENSIGAMLEKIRSTILMKIPRPIYVFLSLTKTRKLYGIRKSNHRKENNSILSSKYLLSECGDTTKCRLTSIIEIFDLCKRG